MKYDNCNLWTGRHHKMMFAFFVQTTLKGEKHMNKEAMKQQILEALSKKLGDGFHLSIQKVLKTNEKLDGLTIRHGNENISPTIYLESFYKALDNGASIDDVMGRILQIYSNSKVYPGHFDTAPFLTYDLPRKKIYVELINRHLNNELLQDIPHRQFLDDFAVIVRCMVSAAEDETASFLVHNCHLNLWGIDQESLISHAIHNTRAMLGTSLQNMGKVIQNLNQGLMESDFPDCPFWVLTNNKKIAGAAAVLFDDILKGFAVEHGNFYVIFSSVHEALLLPGSDQFSIEFLTKMNQEVNTMQVQANEILGTKAYYYNKDKGFVF